MGPLRRGLIAASLIAASPASAEVCDKERPNWSPDNGPVTLWTEPLWVFTNPFILGLLALTCVGLWLRRRWLTVPVALLWGFATFVVATTPNDPSGIYQFALKEGCVGPPHLSIALTAGITAYVLWASILGPRHRS